MQMVRRASATEHQTHARFIGNRFIIAHGAEDCRSDVVPSAPPTGRTEGRFLSQRTRSDLSNPECQSCFDQLLADPLKELARSLVWRTNATKFQSNRPSRQCWVLLEHLAPARKRHRRRTSSPEARRAARPIPSQPRPSTMTSTTSPFGSWATKSITVVCSILIRTLTAVTSLIRSAPWFLHRPVFSPLFPPACAAAEFVRGVLPTNVPRPAAISASLVRCAADLVALPELHFHRSDLASGVLGHEVDDAPSLRSLTANLAAHDCLTFGSEFHCHLGFGRLARRAIRRNQRGCRLPLPSPLPPRALRPWRDRDQRTPRRSCRRSRRQHLRLNSVSSDRPRNLRGVAGDLEARPVASTKLLRTIQQRRSSRSSSEGSRCRPRRPPGSVRREPPLRPREVPRAEVVEAGSRVALLAGEAVAGGVEGAVAGGPGAAGPPRGRSPRRTAGSRGARRTRRERGPSRRGRCRGGRR